MLDNDEISVCHLMDTSDEKAQMAPEKIAGKVQKKIGQLEKAVEKP
jgi:hypothetical protein